MRVGMAAGKVFTNGSYRHRVVIGKDTRLSGYMIESALVSGFTAVGMDVFQLGPMPTPAVAILCVALFIAAVAASAAPARSAAKIPPAIALRLVD